MEGKKLQFMCLTELRRELMVAKAQHDVKKVRKINDLIARNEKDINKKLNEWPKSKMFKFAANILVSEGKGRFVVNGGHVIQEVDMAEVLLKLFDIQRGISKVASSEKRRKQILHEEYSKVLKINAKHAGSDDELPELLQLPDERELKNAGTFK